MAFTQPSPELLERARQQVADLGIAFDDRGLVPVIVQQRDTGDDPHDGLDER